MDKLSQPRQAGLDAALIRQGRAGFVLVNSPKNGHSCPVKITGVVRKHAAEKGIAEDGALKNGTEAMSKHFLQKSVDVFGKA